MKERKSAHFDTIQMILHRESIHTALFLGANFVGFYIQGNSAQWRVPVALQICFASIMVVSTNLAHLRPPPAL